MSISIVRMLTGDMLALVERSHQHGILSFLSYFLNLTLWLLLPDHRYQYPDKVVYTLDQNAPLDVARNEVSSQTLNPSPSKPLRIDQEQRQPLLRVPLQTTVYRNKFLTPSIPIHYQSISQQRGIPTQHSSEIDSDQNSNSMTSFTVNISGYQSVAHEEEPPGDIDLQSLGEEGGIRNTSSRGGENSDRMSISGSAVRNALTRLDNEEFRKDDV